MKKRLNTKNNNKKKQVVEKTTNLEKENEKTSNTNSTREAFLTHPLGSLITKNALPAVASMLFMALYQVVDGILVGRRLGPEALASINVLFPILAVFIGLAVMIGIGGNARIAVLLGAGKTDKARRILGLIVTLGTILGVCGSAVVVLAFPKILYFIGTSGELGNYAGQYLKALYPFFTPMILLFILEQSVRNDGRPNMATMVMAAMAILNIVLDYIFLFPLDLGIRGAALATGLSQSIGATVFLIYFLFKTFGGHTGLSLGAPGGGFSAIGTIVTNGSSELFNNIAAGLTTFLFNRIILSHLGALGVAAFALVQYLLMFGMMILIGMSNGTQPILSYNHGAGLFYRVQGTLSRLLASSFIIGIIFFILLQWQTQTLVTLFIPEHPDALDLTVSVADTISWSMLFMPVGIVGSVFFTAMEKAIHSLVIAILRGLVFILIGLAVFPLLWGTAGIWITPVFSEAATALVTTFLIYQWMRSEHLKSSN
ncbi:MATE family efflux transporter [Clostridium formicaceticum]|uniref:Multidrug export protein MepA n=1 Tax=Clostridium formicaceticum TaxID=1497 RepID=A0AAC9RID6_9CLOT|nr:MATE family efflux transporter [Clostridium formicaceticum]ARE87621.1 Multidrug export protein MepA [Clostridium formicaceticum]